MFNSQFISIIFRLINFGIIAWILIYIFKNKLLNNIKNNISTYKNYFLELTNKTKNLSRRSQDLIIAIEKQKIFTQDLLNKIKRWRNFEQERQYEQLNQNVIVKQNSDQKIIIQEKLLTLNNLQKDLMPVILNDAKTELSKYYDVKQNIIEFEQQLLDFIKKN